MPIFSVAFSSAERTQIALREWVDQRLRPQLLAVPGVAAMDISGGLVREIQVELDPARLRGYGLSVSQVITALRTENQDIAAGRVTSSESELVSKTAGKFRSLQDIRDDVRRYEDAGVTEVFLDPSFQFPDCSITDVMHQMEALAPRRA